MWGEHQIADPGDDSRTCNALIAKKKQVGSQGGEEALGKMK